MWADCRETIKDNAVISGLWSEIPLPTKGLKGGRKVGKRDRKYAVTMGNPSGRKSGN